MSKSFITINSTKVYLPDGVYAERNAQALLLAGHVLHSITNKNELLPCQLNASKEDNKKIIDELMNTEGWLIPAIKSIGELIAAADREEIEDRTLSNIGYLISTLTEFLCLTQYTKRLVISCSEPSNDLIRHVTQVEVLEPR